MRERVGPLCTGCSRMSTVTAPSLSQFSTDLASDSALPEILKKINGPRVVNKRIERHTAVTKKFEAWFSKRDFAGKAGPGGSFDGNPRKSCKILKNLGKLRDETEKIF